MLAGLALALQVIIAPMTLDSVRAVGDSVEFRVAWAFDTARASGFRVDSQQVFWHKATQGAKRRAIARAGRSTLVRFIRRQGNEHTYRLACLRVWWRRVPTLRCVAVNTLYVAAIDVKPDSVTLDASPPDAES